MEHADTEYSVLSYIQEPSSIDVTDVVKQARDSIDSIEAFLRKNGVIYDMRTVFGEDFGGKVDEKWESSAYVIAE